MARKPVIHGRDHAPGGADPIPAVAAAGGGSWPSSYNLPVSSFSPNLGQSGLGTVALDATLPHGFNRNNISAPAIGNYIYWIVDLGPQGSAWEVAVTVGTGSDHGQIEVAWASGPQGDGFNYSDWGSFITRTTPIIECYTASPGFFNSGATYGTFDIGGAAGDELTAFSGAGSYTGYPIGDGGPGLYAMRLHVKGKHASSSSYKVRLAEVVVRRVTSTP